MESVRPHRRLQFVAQPRRFSVLCQKIEGAYQSIPIGKGLLDPESCLVPGFSGALFSQEWKDA
ncbi:MAG: hypothetical protein QM676_07710, partial [Novosphingobium sp.]